MTTAIANNNNDDEDNSNSDDEERGEPAIADQDPQSSLYMDEVRQKLSSLFSFPDEPVPTKQGCLSVQSSDTIDRKLSKFLSRYFIPKLSKKLSIQ